MIDSAQKHLQMKPNKQSWRRLSHHKGGYDDGTFRFSSGSEWNDLSGLMEISPGRRGRRAKARLYVDQNEDGIFSRDELIFSGRTSREKREVIDDLLNGSGSIDLRRDQSTGGMCTLPTIGAVCNFSVRSKMKLITDDGDVVKLQPIGRFRRETITVPVGPQSVDELDDLVTLPLPIPELA